MTEEDRFFLERSVADGTLSRDQADECQTLISVGESPRSIREIVADKGYLSAQQIERLQRKFRLQIQQWEDRALARVLFEKKIVPQPRLKECLDRQNEARQEGKYVPLDRILTSSRLLDKEAITQIQFSPEFHAQIEREKRQQPSPSPAATSPSREEETLGGYQIRDKIAEGGMGIIFRAYQVGLDREVALKVLSPSLQMKREFVDKFIGEAKMAASLSHPNLVHVHEIGQEGDRRYYSMELVEGTNLHELMKKEGRLPQERAIEITLQIAKALQAIHERGIVHRDVKPDNIILRKDGIPILVDLGLAIYTNQDHSDEKAMGNPYYIAPEMIEKPAEVDTRADIYSLGSTFYRMLSGQHAVEGDTPREIVKNLLRKKVTPLEEIDHTIGEDVAKICRRMMRHDLSKRYMAMEMVVQALDRLLFFH